MDDVAAFVGDDVGGAQVVGVDERFIRLALLLEAAAGFGCVNRAGHGSAPGDGIAVGRFYAFDVAQVAGGFGDRDAVLFELVGATEAVAARAVYTDSELLGPAIMNPAFTQNYLQGPTTHPLTPYPLTGRYRTSSVVFVAVFRQPYKIWVSCCSFTYLRGKLNSPPSSSLSSDCVSFAYSSSFSFSA